MAEIILKREDVQPLTEEARRRIEAIGDENIDYSDIPPLGDDFLQGAVKGRFYRPLEERSKAKCCEHGEMTANGLTATAECAVRSGRDTTR